INGFINPPPPPPFITDIQYAPGSSTVAWAATSEAAGWDDVPVAGGGIIPRSCQGVLRTENASSTNPVPTWNVFSLPNSDANCVYAVAPISPTQVYAATKAGLWKGTYTSPTTSWTQIPLGAVGLNQRVSSIFYPSPVGPQTTLYVGLARPSPFT